MTNLSPIEHLGFDDGYLDAVDPVHSAGRTIARVVAVHKDSYTINNGQTEFLAEPVGRLRYSARSPLDFPAVGDWVLANIFDPADVSIIHGIIPRRTLLKRKTPGKQIEFQLIAANIDTALIMQSLDANFNLRRLERYLVMVNESRIEPMVLLSKSDLLDPEAITAKTDAILRIMPNLTVVPFSNLNRADLKTITDLLMPRRTYCLLGSSGVGKTTLLNHLLGKSQFATKPVRTKDAKGRHATTTRHLIRLSGGALVVDTPGMRELGNISVPSGIDETFAEMAALARQCRFRDCNHADSPGCAVLAAVESGRISRQRYENYIKMTKESAYHSMSYLEKRRKDKQFGKLVKHVMKHKPGKR
jgi:ribosome biogenesis GTPase